MQVVQSSQDLLSLPSAERQLVIFADPKGGKTEADGRTEIRRAVVHAISPVFSGSLVNKLIDQYAGLSKAGVPFVVAPIQVAQGLQFTPGHPRLRLLYAAHPVDPRIYYPAAEFHRYVFEHKLSEAVNLLMHLGAKEFTVEHKRGWDKKFAAKIAADIPDTPIDLDANVGVDSKSGSHILFHGEFAGHNNPCLPDDMVWYNHESTWKTLADGRIKFGQKRISLQINYNEDFNINGGLKAKVEGAGFDMGGSFEEQVNTSWSITGTFGE